MSHRTFFVGTGSDRIYTCRLTNEGQMLFSHETSSGKGPSWLIDRHGLIYATNEQEDQIEIFQIEDPIDGRIKSIKKVSAHGSTPCSLDIDPTGQWLAIANYGGLGEANFILMKLKSNDHLPDEESVQIEKIDGHGPHAERQDRSHCHQVQFYQNHLYGVDLGTDTMNIYHYTDRFRLAENRIFTQAGAGPRHLLIHPNGSFAYLVNELDSTTNVYRLNPDFQLIQTISTRNSSEKENTAAELHFTVDGKFLLVSNRGDDNIVVYQVNDGLLTTKEFLDIRGSGPRYFTFDPTGKYLLIANQDSNNIICLSYDSSRGSFEFISQLVNIQTPQHLLFLR